MSSSGTPVPERHGHERDMDNGESSTKGHKDDEGTGASHIRGKAERVRTAQPSEEKAQGDLNICRSEHIKKIEPGSFQRCPVTGQEATERKLKDRRCHLNIRKDFYCEGG